MVKLLGRKSTVLVAVFSVWLLLLSSSSFALGAQSRGGTTPGEELLAVGGTLVNGQSTLPYQVFHTGIVNFELTVAGGASANALSLTVTQNGTPTTWTARSGERFWGTVDLTTTANSWVVSNTSGVQLSYTLRVYTEGEVPVVADGGTTWSGTAVGGASPSTIRLTFPTSGLYDFAFSVGGRYQFTLDDAYLQQTVEGNETVRAYVAAGTHTLSILQDPAVISTIWGVSVTAVAGAPGDTLPYTQSDGQLGGTGDAFDEIWFPLSVAAAGEVNLEIAVTGGADDLVMVELYNSATGGTPAITGVEAHGGETVWLPASLVAGVNRLHVMTDAGNAASVAVTLTVHAVPSTPYTWSGESSGDNARNSQILLDVPTSGLYTFTFTVGSGRYQFALDNEYLQSSVEADGTVTAYIPAGRHTLTLRQDPTVALTAWSVAIADGGAPTDTLPYQQVSGEIGGTGNAFTEDWWPLALAAPAQANVRVTVVGDPADSLSVEVFGATALNQVPATVYGGETRWLTVDLTAGVNRLHFVGNDTGGSLTYQVDVYALEEAPTEWAGVALQDGGDSFVRFIAPTAGTYNIEFSFSEGAILPVVDPAAPVAPLEPLAGEPGTVRVRVPLTAGVHTLQLVHDRNLPRTVWEGSVSLYAPLPGGDLLSVSGTLAPDQSTLAYQVFHTGIVNFELTVDGGTPADSLMLSVGQGGTPQTWIAQSGERFWGTIDLSTTTNTWVVSNPTSNVPLDFTLKVYAQGTVPVVADGGTTWSGTAVGNGSPSTIRLNFPTSGLYTFSFTVGGGGRYQFLLDSDYLQQTVEAGEAVEAYVAAGTHTLQIWQDPAVASTEWGVSMSAIPNAPADTLPYAQTDGELGGTGDAFDEAWFPLAYSDTVAVNVMVEVVGAATDEVLVELYNSQAPTPEWSVTAFGGETVWIPASLVALPGGVNRLHFSATGNADSVRVITTVHDVPTTPYAWVGDARGNGVNSQILLDVPTSGLYEFDFGVQSGRFQFALNDQYFQTSVEQSGPVTVYVPAGRHTLTVRQDSTVALTEWAVGISAAGATWDTLPYTQMSGEIGGSANDFSEDWWPLALAEPAQANVRIMVTGNPSDSLTLDIIGASGLSALGADTVYGGETRWVTVDLTAGVNLLHFVGNSTGSPLTYQVDVYALEMVPTEWAGVALAAGDDSYVRFIAPVNGTYDIEFNFSEGAILPVVDPAAPLAPIQASDDLTGTIRIRVPLTTGVHTLQLVHDRNLPRTVWDGNVTLRSPAEDLTLTALDPAIGLVGEPLTVTLTGTGFELGAEVTFISTVDGSAHTGTTLAVSNDGTTMEVLVPATLIAGSHDVRVDNPASGQTTTLPAALTLVQPFAITSVAPATIPQGASTVITITGSFFTAGMTAHLEDSSGAHTPVTVEFVSATMLRITAPATLALGSYDLILERAQPAQTERVEDAITVINVSFPVYLPLLSRAP